MSTVSRAIRAVALFDHKSQQADDDAAVQRIGIPRSVRHLRGHEGVAVPGKEGMGFHGARP
jgi:hypothetical protein